MKLDIIVPCFNEQDCVKIFYKEITNVMGKLKNCSLSVYFVDDGSRDNTLNEIKTLVRIYGEDNVKFLSFARNFGKESAIFAGLQASRGDLVVLMDCDLQDPPTLLPKMLNEIHQGYDCVAAYRTDRNGEPPVRSLFAAIFYGLMNKFSDVKLKPSARDYRMMTAQMRDAVLLLGERERFSKGLFSWVGFNTKWLEYQNIERVSGTTKWSFFKLIMYAIGGITAFTTAPLRLASLTGGGVVFLSILYAVYRIVTYGFQFDTGSIVILLVLFLFGVNIAFLGVIGEYMAKMYSEIKCRPIFIIKETNCGRDNKS